MVWQVAGEEGVGEGHRDLGRCFVVFVDVRLYVPGSVCGDPRRALRNSISVTVDRFVPDLVP